MTELSSQPRAFPASAEQLEVFAEDGSRNDAAQRRKPKRASKKGAKAAIAPPPKLRFGGAVAAELGKALENRVAKPTKFEVGQSAVPDAIDALQRYPGTKLKELWPILASLDPQCDGATFRRAVLAGLQRAAERYPAVALSLRGAPKQSDRNAAGLPAAAPPISRDDTDDAVAQALRGLRADGF